MKKLITLCVLAAFVFSAKAQEPSPIPVDTRTVKGCAASNDLAQKAVAKIAILPDEEFLAAIYQGMSDGRVCYAVVVKCVTQALSKEVTAVEIHYRVNDIDYPVVVYPVTEKQKRTPGNYNGDSIIYHEMKRQ